MAYENGKVALPGNLAAALDGEAECDPHETALQLANIGRSYKADYTTAARLLAQVGSKIDPSKLSAATLAQLAIFADHLARHATGRPM